ncbi:Hypothetical predicted protein [Octopus vulgaris]|uniref:Uncharacterized protein n=1 Tax=Octopus vulgaris TaxID=6645 RepID=A0AA36BQ07_OCTVU|nr:Hypothetical predicted protein [Octopus vulgaris]
MKYESISSSNMESSLSELLKCIDSTERKLEGDENIVKEKMSYAAAAGVSKEEIRFRRREMYHPDPLLPPPHNYQHIPVILL